MAQVCRENILFPTQLISEQVHKLLRWAYDVQTLGLGEAEMHKKQNMPSRNLQSSRDPDKKKKQLFIDDVINLMGLRKSFLFCFL